MPYYYYFDYTYLVFVLPALIIALIAQGMVSSRFERYSKVHSARGLTAEEVARNILRSYGVYDVQVEGVPGKLTDHFDPKAKVVRLSQSVCNSTSIAAIGVAAHECGHAIQYQENYLPIRARAAIIPVTNIGSKLAVPLIIVGLLLSSFNLIMLGIIAYSLMAVFQIITLPVEFNASRRALRILEQDHILLDNEIDGARKVLGAAALTYVAALLSTVAQILRFLVLANRRRR